MDWEKQHPLHLWISTPEQFFIRRFRNFQIQKDILSVNRISVHQKRSSVHHWMWAKMCLKDAIDISEVILKSALLQHGNNIRMTERSREICEIIYFIWFTKLLTQKEKLQYKQKESVSYSLPCNDCGVNKNSNAGWIL